MERHEIGVNSLWRFFIFAGSRAAVTSSPLSLDLLAFPGFPGGRQSLRGTNLLFDQFFLKTPWKWRKFGPGMGAFTSRMTPEQFQTKEEITSLLFWIWVPSNRTLFYHQVTEQKNIVWRKPQNKEGLISITKLTYCGELSRSGCLRKGWIWKRKQRSSCSVSEQLQIK